MKSVLVANQGRAMKVKHGWKVGLKAHPHIRREVDFFETSQHNSYC